MTDIFSSLHDRRFKAGDSVDPLPDNVAIHPRADRARQVRILEAILFAATEPVREDVLCQAMPEGCDISALLAELQHHYKPRGINLVQVAGGWAFRTADDLGHLLRHESVGQKRLSRAALETLAIIAYHQPVTRAEIEEIRGVSMSKGTLDQLMEIGWVRMRGRRRTPGRPVTYGTTDHFMDHFALASLADLPGVQELKGAGLLEGAVPADFDIPAPSDDDVFGPDELLCGAGDDEPALEMHLTEGLESER